MTASLRVAALAAATALTCAAASASTFQVISGQQRSFILSNFGDTGQSFVAADPILNSFGFQFTALNPTSANLPFTFSLYAGQTLTGTALVTRTVTLPTTIGSTPTWYDFDLGSTAVTAGQLYTAVLSSSSSRVGPVMGPDINIFTGAELSGDAYLPGRALFTREVYPNCAQTGHCDLNFRVTGTGAVAAVPEPASWGDDGSAASRSRVPRCAAAPVRSPCATLSDRQPEDIDHASPSHRSPAFRPGPGRAQAFPTTPTPIQLGAGTYSENFDSLAATGTTGTALPQGFQVIETGSNANTSYGVGTGSSNGGNSYSFGAANATDRALGSLGSGSITQVLFGGVVANALGSTITGLTFSYTGEQWRLGNSSDDGLVFQYLVGATGVAGTAGWTTVTSLGFAPLFTNGTSTGAALDGNLAANQRALTGTITGLTLAAGQTLGFRWVDIDSTGSDQGLGVDNLSISAITSAAPAVPEPATWAMMLVGFGAAGAALRRRPSFATGVRHAG